MDRVQKTGEGSARSGEKPAVVPMPQERWRHWKGQVCTIAHISSAIQPAKEGDRVFITSNHWQPHAAGNINSGDTVVLYWHDAEKLWARSLQDFTAVLGDTGDPSGGTMFYRFEKVPEQSIEQSLPETTDASVWAAAFVKANSDKAISQDLMLGWFANAIMAGWDGAVRSMGRDRD